MTVAMPPTGRHVVFVDDEPALLNSLRQMLPAGNEHCRTSFLSSAEAALDLLTVEPVDVVVTDMLMLPGMDGAALLDQIRARWPQIVRILLSEHPTQSASVRNSTVAHQCLGKPLDPVTLTSTVRKACNLADRLSRPELRRLLGGIDTLPKAPRSFVAINAALAEPDACAASVAEVIEQDAGTSAKMLQLVNSAFFGLARRITTVHDAITFLGLTPVRGIVLASNLANGLGRTPPDLGNAIETINDHSLAVAAVARELVPADRRLDAFTAGMLHDVGRLALAASAPALFRRVNAEHEARGVPIAVIEREILEATHADLGAYLLQMWGLPLTLIEPVARHHDPDAADDPDPIVAAVATAEATIVSGSRDGAILLEPAEEGDAALLGLGHVSAKSGTARDGMRAFVRSLIGR